MHAESQRTSLRLGAFTGWFKSTDEPRAFGRTTALLQHLNAVVVAVTQDHAPIAVDGDTTAWMEELAVTAALAADGAGVRAVAVIQHLHAMIALLDDNQMAGAIKRNALRISKLAIV